MKKMMMVLVMMIGCAMSVMSQSAKIDKIWVDHNTYENNQLGMRIHVKFNVYGLKNQEIQVAAAFYNGNNNIKCYTNGYNSSANTLQLTSEAAPGYENTIYNDFRMFMPYYIFNNCNMESGSYQFFVAIRIKTNFKQIASSDWQSFTFTSGKKNMVKNPEVSTNIELTYTKQRQCEQCNGSGKCRSCNGSGYGSPIYTSSRGWQYITCFTCKGSGRCSLFGCGGSGYKSYTVNYTAQELNSKGVTEWNNGNYNKAFKYFQKSAESSYGWGMYNLGHCYELGRGCEKSRAMAVHWYKKAANKDNEDAIKALDRLEGNSRPNDDKSYDPLGDALGELFLGF